MANSGQLVKVWPFISAQKCVIYAPLRTQYGYSLSMRIGHHQLTNCLIAAPMAGITDRPFRTLCHAMGAGMAVSEMLSSNPEVWRTDKSRLRMVHSDEPGIRSVQIAGCDPDDMAAAARINVAERCTDHRHQYGLPGQESEPETCRVCFAAVPGSG
jgi:tRNA-dihydrouridine synthase B